MFDEPTFLIQVGFGGRPRVENAMQHGYADGAILSPADYKKKDSIDLAESIRGYDGTVLFDPHFYIPETDRNDMATYPYFQSRGGDSFDTSLVDDQSEREALCEDILSIQESDLEVDAYIAPARFLDTFSQLKLDRWLDLSESFLEVAESKGESKPVFASLPIDGKQLNDDDYRDQLLNRVTSLDPDGFYVSVKYDYNARYPLNGYSNVYSFLDLLTTLRENQYEVLVGHTHHIAHLFLGLGINAFAAGHYKNLRAFDTNRWEPSDDESFGRQVVRYYSDILLSDIRVDPDLQYLHESGFPLEYIRINSPFESDLFDPATTPEESGWAFSDQSWDHYLWACDYIRRQYLQKDLDERLETAERAIQAAKLSHKRLEDAVSNMGQEFDNLDSSHIGEWEVAFEDIKSDARLPSLKIALL
jgi:hypothetical protein